MTSLVETKDIWKNNLVFALYPLTSVKKAKKKKRRHQRKGKSQIGVRFCKIIKNSFQ